MEDTQGKIFLSRTDSTVLVLIATMIFGGVVIIFGYIVTRYSRSHGDVDSTKGATVPEKGKRIDSRNSLTGSTTNSSVNKRTKNKKRRETQQEFTHSWVVGTLKGHTSTIFNMSFSSNGKLLASCGEDGMQPNKVVQEGTGESSSKSFCRRNPTLVRCSPPVTIKDDWNDLNLHSSPVNLSNHHHHHHQQNASINAQSEYVEQNNQQQPIINQNSKLTPQQQIFYTQQMQIHAQMYHHSIMLQQRKLYALCHTGVNYPWDLPQYKFHVLAQQQRQDQQRLHQRQMHLHSQMQMEMQQRYVQEQMQIQEELNKRRDVIQKMNVSLNNSYVSFNNSNATLNTSNQSLNDTNGASSMKIENMNLFYSNPNVSVNHNQISNNTGFTYRYIFNINDVSLEYLLRTYTHHTYYLIEAGYPFSWNFDFRIKRYIYNLHQSKNKNRPLDVNAKEFVPNGTYKKLENGDSGNNSSNSSDMEQENQLDDEEPKNFIRSASFSTNRKPGILANIESLKRQRRNSISNLNECSSIETRCSRCLKSFYMYQANADNAMCQNDCIYHNGELSFQRNGKYKIWTCCKQRTSSLGCTSNETHEWIGLKKNYNGPYVDFVRTIPTKKIPANGIYGVYGMDCEMVITTSGFELAKITMVDICGVVVYDHFVKPTSKIVDYNTNYSGITEENLAGDTKTIKEVQQDLLSFVNAETVLIGHGLENDLRALHMLHFTVIDTALLLRHTCDLPYRHSLKKLTKLLLSKDIQESSHNSIEDARCAIDLVLWKLKFDGL